MKYLSLLMIPLVLFSCKEKPDADTSSEQDATAYTFYLGTYTGGESQGIYKYGLSPDGRFHNLGLKASSSNPSYLAKDNSGKVLIAVNEDNNDGTGTVSAFAIEEDTLRFINTRATGGAHPCHVSITADNLVLVSNYTGGNLSLFQLNDQTGISERLDLKQHTGKGSTDRQEAPHVHFAKEISANKQVVASDLGTNELWFYRMDSTHNQLVATEQVKLKMNEGGGPRHWSLHPNGKWLFVLNELNSEIQQVTIGDNDEFKLGPVSSILPEGFTEGNTGADIHISSDGNFVYASNRGHNSIAILKIASDDGSLGLIGHESTKGDGPRNFSLSPDEKFLIVANQNTNNIVSYSRDLETGLLTFVDEIKAPTPVCILF